MRARLLMAAFLAPLLAACGGGGGGDPVLPEQVKTFDGEYGYAGFDGEVPALFGATATIGESIWGRMSASDNGRWQRTDEHLNFFGQVDPPTLILSDPTKPWQMLEPLELLREANRPGTLREDGEVGASITFLPPGIELFTRPGGLLLPGEYFLAIFSYFPSGDSAVWGTASLTADGRVTNILLSGNTNGSLIAERALPDEVFASTPDGRMTMTLGLPEFAGTVASGSEFALFGGSTVDGENLQSVGVLVRLSSGATDARFNGTYRGVSIRATTLAGSTPHWRARRRTAVADGAGSFQTADGVGSTDGRWEAPASNLGASQAYSVGPLGTLTVPNLAGAISPDGRTVVLAGRNVAAGAPTLEFWIR